jgi:hypothetical protein
MTGRAGDIIADLTRPLPTIAEYAAWLQIDPLVRETPRMRQVVVESYQNLVRLRGELLQIRRDRQTLRDGFTPR